VSSDTFFPDDPELQAKYERWTESQRRYFDRAMQSTDPAYRESVLRALLNVGATPEDETWMLLAIVGFVVELSYGIRDRLEESSEEFHSNVEMLEDRLRTLRADQEKFQVDFPVLMQKILEAVTERIQSVAIEKGSAAVTAAIASEESRIRVAVIEIIKDEARRGFAELREEGFLPASSNGQRAVANVAAGGLGPFRLSFIDKQGRPLVFRFNGLLTLAFAIAVSLIVGLGLGQWRAAHTVVVSHAQHLSLALPASRQPVRK
jgi:chaperonin cofactor prefoldin